MSVTAKDFLTFAEPLKNSKNEIDQRNYISRSYYHIYHLTKPLADSLPPTHTLSAKDGSHEYLIKKLKDQPNTHPQALKLRSLAILIATTRANRNLADYELDDTVDVSKHSDDFDNVINKLKELG